jgi:hypothetical protein
MTDAKINKERGAKEQAQRHPYEMVPLAETRPCLRRIDA